MSLQFLKAGTSDALVLAGLSRQAFNSDVKVGAASSGGPPGYQSVPFHARMARMNHLFKLADENGVIMGGAILFRKGDTLNIGRIFIDPQHFRKEYGILMMREIEAMFPDVKVFTLDTPAWNTRTNAFYTKLGYSEVKRDTDFVYYSKKTLTAVQKTQLLLTFPGTLYINAPGVLLFLLVFRFFPKSNLSGCSSPVRHEFPPQKNHFREFPHISSYFRFENVHFENFLTTDPVEPGFSRRES